MNDTSIVATQARSLMNQLDQERARRCRELEREAVAWARAHLQQARTQARTKVHAAIELARDRHRREISAAEAEIEGERRGRRQLELAGVLAQVMQRLPEELAARWRDPATRRRWIEATLKDALRRLGTPDWTIRHAPGLEPREARARCGEIQLRWQEDPGLVAGLVIEKPGARMDASAAGLLANSTELQSRILSLLNDSIGEKSP